MRILIVVPRFASRPGEHYEFPLGLAYVSGALKAAGFEVACLNLNHRPGPADEIVAREARRADLLLTGGLSVHYGLVRRIVGQARAANPGIVAVAGGGLVSSEPGLMQGALGLDYGVIGEGEATVVELARALEAREDPSAVAGLVLTGPDSRPVLTAERTSARDLDALPRPDYDGLDAGAYLDAQRGSDVYYLNGFDAPRVLPVISSRSCPFNCTFCYHPLGKRYRERSLDDFFAELDGLAGRFGINGLVVLDELFAHDRARMEDFAGRIEPLGLKWLAQLRVDAVDQAVLDRLKRAGLFCISYGLESADDAILTSMRKHTTLAAVESALAATRRAGIGIQGNFLFGDPAETPRSAANTLDWWERHPQYQISLTWVIPYPGSPLYDGCLARGVIPDRLAYLEAGCPAVNMTAMAPRELSAIGARIARLTADHRLFAEIADVRPLGPDPLKGGPAYDFSARCPHCGGLGRYKGFVVDRPEFFKLACRACNQRFDVSPADFDHYARAVRDLHAALADARAQGRRLAVVPTLFEPTLRGILDLLRLDAAGLDIACFLDDRPERQGPGYLGRYDVLPLDAATLARLAPDHAVFLLPVSDRERLAGLLRAAGAADPIRLEETRTAAWED